MKDEQQKKISDCLEYAWFGLRDERTEKYPIWTERLRQRIFLWLDGETVEFVEFGFSSATEDGLAVNAREAGELWGVILTERLLLRVEVTKAPESVDVDRATAFDIVPRSAITDLAFEVVTLYHREHMVVHASYVYGGKTLDLEVPTVRDDSRYSEDDRRALFLSLRDDLFPRR